MSSTGKRFLGRLGFVVLAFSFVGVTCPGPVRVRCEERVLRFDALVDAPAV